MGRIFYETPEQRKHVHTSWEKVEATDETYWRCFDCRVTADEPVIPEDNPKAVVPNKVWAKLHFLELGFNEDTVLYELVPKEVGRLSHATTQDIAEFLRKREISKIVMDSAPQIIDDLRLRYKVGRILKTLRLPPKRKDGVY